MEKSTNVSIAEQILWIIYIYKECRQFFISPFCLELFSFKQQMQVLIGFVGFTRHFSRKGSLDHIPYNAFFSLLICIKHYKPNSKGPMKS